jgi:hypothetical protein
MHDLHEPSTMLAVLCFPPTLLALGSMPRLLIRRVGATTAAQLLLLSFATLAIPGMHMHTNGTTHHHISLASSHNHHHHHYHHHHFSRPRVLAMGSIGGVDVWTPIL